MNYPDVKEFFSAIKNYHKDIGDNFEPPPIILPKLRSYQRKAVKWMLDREKNNDMTKSDGSPFCGGILADEMGLGKTVEMLSCIASNMAPPEFYTKRITVKDCQNNIENKPKADKTLSLPSTSKYVIHSSTKNMKKRQSKTTRSDLQNWYSGILDGMSTVSKKKVESDLDEDTVIVECYCVQTPPKSTLVICAMCGKGQHAECTNFMPKPFQEVPYLCASCWYINDKLQCKATLIVVPLSILNQWLNEIEKHIAVPGLKVLVYNGIHADGYIQPISFNEYDIVITSYSNLSRDLNFVGESNISNRNSTRLRHSKKYNYPQSPLPCIKWWRICLDEGQAVESLTCKVSEMMSSLQSVNSWAMTGTPVQKSLNDLYGIIKFLDVSPYYDRKQFLQLMNGDNGVMYCVFSNLIWRNSLEDVNSELCIPKLTTEQHWLTFSQIEKHFYQSQHGECASLFTSNTQWQFTSLDISVKDIGRKRIISVFEPLFKLRQACVHPQAVNGQFLKIKGTMTMEKLMDVMIEKCRIECNDILRSLVSQHNAIAGLYLIRSQTDSAVEHYRVVLGLMEKYKDKKLKIDTVQKIHVMYNLSTVIDEKDSNLKNDMEQLEKEYLGASKQNVETTRKTVEFYSVKLATLVEDKTLSYSDWWSDMLDWIFPPEDFLSKVQQELDDYRVPGVPNIANKLETMNDVYNILGVWLSDLDSARNDTIHILKTFEETPMADLIESALLCHLRLKSKKSYSKNRCFLCRAERQLQLYESLLFSVSNKQKSMSADTDEENDDETMYESTSKGLWKMSQKEFLLMKLFQYGQAKIINKNCLNDAAEHMKILELVRKEFRYLRLLWTHLSDNLSAHDEIVMAKSRLRLRGDENSEAHEGPPNKKAKKDNENDVVMEQYVDYNMMSLLGEIPLTEGDLEKTIGTLIYLENLKKEKENSSEMEPCPICCLSSESGWAVLQCGHSVCGQCLSTMYNHSEASNIVCPMCRNPTPIVSVSYVKTLREDDASGIKMKGSFSTKIESIVLKLIELIAEDPKIKVLIFSTWEKALKLLGEALEQNSINHRTLKNGNKYNKTLEDFKANENINALLMKLNSGSKGLNLTEASRVFFIEPIINKADELQAIGRIHRIGQKNPTFVHHFIIRDSIEENITKIFSNDQIKGKWDDITLAELTKVFERNQSL